MELTHGGLYDGIIYNSKKLTLAEKRMNSKISSIRVSIERVFGTLKENYGFHRTKYLGIIKTRGQLLLSSIAFNLKKITTFVN